MRVLVGLVCTGGDYGPAVTGDARLLSLFGSRRVCHHPSGSRRRRVGTDLTGVRSSGKHPPVSPPRETHPEGSNDTRRHLQHLPWGIHVGVT